MDNPGKGGCDKKQVSDERGIKAFFQNRIKKYYYDSKESEDASRNGSYFCFFMKKENRNDNNKNWGRTTDKRGVDALCSGERE